MRIDYSEPKKSFSVPPKGSQQSRPRKESSPGVMFAVCITAILCLGIGFGGGWTLSQRSAKKGFKAALEQQSLENRPQKIEAQPPVQQTAPPAAPQPVAAPQPHLNNTNNTSTQTPSAVASPPANDPPLSFYKTLPSGKKSNTLGSGINVNEEKPAKLPLQAAMPTNLTRPAPSQPDEATKNQAVKVAPAAPANNIHQESNYHTVQFASFSLRSEAETVRSKLAAKGYNVSIVESRQGDKGTWYRVRVGSRLDPEAAKELATKLGKGAMAVPEKD